MSAAGAGAAPLRWWGWGERDVNLSESFLSLLRQDLDTVVEPARRPPHLEDVVLPASSLPSRLRRLLVDAAGRDGVRDDDQARIRHAAGRSYLDLLQLRSGRLREAPDAVVHPATSDSVGAVLRVCAEQACSVVPFGGGTSVVGGVAPRHDAERPLIALDLDRLRELVEVDGSSLSATLQAGMRGPRMEAELARHRLTLGHFPQSFEYATAGGFAATRSAGQASTGYGRFDEMLLGLRLESPAGALRIPPGPPGATGPSLLQIVAGSEGSLGVITEVAVRVRPRPPVRHYAAWTVQDIDTGLDVLRRLAQSERLPDVARLADAEETRVSWSMARGQAAAAVRSYLRLRGQPKPCLLILGWEGDGERVGVRVRWAAPALGRAGAVALGAAPARAWLRDRFLGPYIRDALLDRGLVAETLETAGPWSRLSQIRERVLEALRGSLTAQGTPPVIGSHVSHVYPEGASLYFTVLARQCDGGEEEQWLRAKRAVTDAIVSSGARLSHHHGIGADHAAWMREAHGDAGVALIRALKRELDPSAIMNPHKLIAEFQQELT